MEPKALVEAALFVADRPVALARLAQVTGLSEQAVGRLLQVLAEEYGASDRGIELIQEKGGYLLQVKPELAEVVRPLAPGQEVSEPVLRTLALIAYRGSILQSEVVRLRGQRAYSHIRELVDRGWVRAEEEGPTKRLSVTKALLAYFRVRNPEELRALISPPEASGGEKANTF